MNKIIKLAMAALFSASAAIHTHAATTNYWVQNVNIKLVAYVQSGNGGLLNGRISTKQFLSFLSGVTNPALASVASVGPVTNSYYTNLTVEATDFSLLPDPTTPPADMPRSYAYTTNYVVTPDGGTTYYTNNVNFTNDVIVTRGAGTNVVYTFNNSVTVPTNRIAYLFPALPAASISAVLTNHGSGPAFALSGYVLTNSVTTGTNYTYARNPDFSSLHGAKLLMITPVVGGTNYPSRFVVRYKSGKEFVDVDVSNFLSEYYGSPYISVYQSLYPGAPTRIYAYSGIDFNNGIGTSFNFVGFDTQVWGLPGGKGKSITTPVLRQRKLAVSNYGGSISGRVGNRDFSYATTVVRGNITISGGKIE